MLVALKNDYYYNTFADRFNDKIIKHCPQLEDVLINLIDDSEACCPAYLRELYANGSKITDTSFCSYCNHDFQNVVYNDIVRINDVAKGLTEEEQYALIAHEVGHFAACYSKAGVKEQEEEIYADNFAKKLGFVNSLRSALYFSIACLQQEINKLPPFMPEYAQKYKEDIKNIEERIKLI